MARTSADHPEAHYDSVTQAWRYLMGESFHYGYFTSPLQELREATEALTKLMANRGHLEAGHHVLDVGCGIGEPAMYLALHFGCRVIGISTSGVGIAAARAQVRNHNLESQVAFLVGDGMANGFENRTFDRVWLMESSHLMPDKAALIRDSARVLKSGGRMVLCDIIVQRDLSVSQVLTRAKAFDLLRTVFGRAKMETLNAYKEWCQDAGLRVNSSEDISSNTAPTFDHWRENAKRYREEVTTLIGERSWLNFLQACDVMKNMWEEEVLGYGLVEAQKPG